MLACKKCKHGAFMKDVKNSAGGYARAEKLNETERKLIAQKAANARWDKNKNVPQAQYSGELIIGTMRFPCSVLSDGSRVLTQTDFMEGMGMYYSGWISANRSVEDIAADVPQFLLFKNLKPFVDKHLGDLQEIVVNYRTEKGALARGVRAEIVPKICDVWLDTDEHGQLGIRQKRVVSKAKLIMRALAHVGIAALVDEATGYQKDRAVDALSKILEQFIAKELRPWIKTFPSDFYEELCRLRSVEFPADKEKRQNYPSYFGHITNDIIYKRLAPGVLEELKKQTPKTEKGNKKHQFHRKLSENIGHPKLLAHLDSVVTVMKLSDDGDYQGFMKKLDRVKPRYDETLDLPFKEIS